MPYTQAQLVAAYTAANDGVAPDAATTQLLAAFATQTQTGQLSDAAALSYVINSADKTTAVAVEAYQFFTGKTPSKAGLDYLVNSSANPTDLNDPYYAAFNIENRYMNFAANLGIVGEGATTFNATYGTTAIPSFATFIGVIYEQIIGSAYAQAAGINVTAAINDVIGRQAAFTQIARERGIITATSSQAQIDLATRAVAVGYLMVEGIKADVGVYAAGANNFTNALINGNAQYNVNLLTTYSVQGGGTGTNNGGGGPVATGTTFTLTTAQDTVNGTAGNDTINALVVDNSAQGGAGGAIGGIASGTTLSLGDVVNGSGGVDTLNITTNVTAATTLSSIATISNVENINIVNNGGNGKVVTFDASTASGQQMITLGGNGDLTVTNSTAGVGAVGTSVATGNTQTVTATGASSVMVGNNTRAGTGKLVVDLSGGASATVALNASTAGAGTLDTLKLGTGTTALNVNSGTTGVTIGANGTGITETTANKLTTVTITGAGTANLGVLPSNALKSVDASTSSGANTVSIGTNVATTYLGGSGVDTVTIAAGVAMTGTVDGGAGTGDILSISDSKAGGGNITDTSLTAATSKLFTNFEILRVASTKDAAGAAADVATFDASLIPASITKFQLGTSTASVTVTNLPAAASVEIVGNQAGTDVLQLKDSSGGTDVINLTVTGTSTAGTTVAGVTATGVETVNITDTGGTGASQNTLKLNTDPSLTTVKLTGAGVLTFTGDNYTKGVTIDGSAHTGSLTIAGATAATAALNIYGGTANDSITTGKAGNSQIVGGAGGDAITVTAGGVHTIAFKAGTDSVYDVTTSAFVAGAAQTSAGASATSSANTGKMDNITGFASGTDKIDITFAGNTQSQNVMIDKGTYASVDLMATALNTAGVFADGVATRSVLQAHVGGDTFLVVDVNHNGAFDAAGDLVVRFVGTALLAQGDLIGS